MRRGREGGRWMGYLV